MYLTKHIYLSSSGVSNWQKLTKIQRGFLFCVIFFLFSIVYFFLHLILLMSICPSLLDSAGRKSSSNEEIKLSVWLIRNAHFLIPLQFLILGEKYSEETNLLFRVGNVCWRGKRRKALPGAVIWRQEGAVLLWARECQDAEGGLLMGQTWELVQSTLSLWRGKKVTNLFLCKLVFITQIIFFKYITNCFINIFPTDYLVN